MTNPLAHRRARMGGRDPHEEHRVATPLELLFDLVFVVAYGLAADELAHYLAEGHIQAALIGFAIAAVGVLALISLWHGNPRPFGGYGRLSGAAGMTGALASWPLGKLVSGIGVAIVWGGAVLLGLLIFTGTPLSAIWERIVDAFTREGDALLTRGLYVDLPPWGFHVLAADRR